jgi:dienelactone hydrolase
MWKQGLALVLWGLTTFHCVEAAVQTKTIKYSEAGVELEGFLAWDDAISGPRPGVLVVHEWWGLNDYCRDRAKQLAGLGYVAFAVDMYGAGKNTEHPQEAGEWMGKIRANRKAWRSRASAGLNVLKSQSQVDPGKLAAIGYCFGGSTVLELAFADAPVKGVASFHGGLTPPEGISGVKSKVLICTGLADDFIPPDQVNAFMAGMQKISADVQLVTYAGVRHGFTNPKAGTHGIDNLKYDAQADHRSWGQLQAFLKEVFE